MSDDPILAALARLETGQASLRAEVKDVRTDFLAELGKTRADLMARMDRLQARLDGVDEHLTMGLGYMDRVDRRSSALTEDNRLLGELLISLTGIVRRLERRV